MAKSPIKNPSSPREAKAKKAGMGYETKPKTPAKSKTVSKKTDTSKTKNK